MSAANREPRVWVLNLDAEHELEAGRRYSPTRRLASIVARQGRTLVGAFVGALVAPGDLVVPESAPSDELREAARGRVGLAWSPTPRALAALARVGATPLEAPDVATLAAVNARPFAATVRAALTEESFAKDVALDLDGVLRLLARPAGAAPLGWLVRRTFGAAGRGRRRIAAGAPDDAELAWLVAGLRRGPLTVEPFVRVAREYTRSGRVDRDGRVFLSAPCVQHTTAAGAWTGSEPALRDDVPADDDRRLAAAFEAAGRALASAGYFGPFGIDAFRHRSTDGTREVLNPLSEINARFTMDWTGGLDGEAALAALVDAHTPVAAAARGFPDPRGSGMLERSDASLARPRE